MSTAGHIAAYAIIALEHQCTNGTAKAVCQGNAAVQAFIEDYCEVRGWEHQRGPTDDLIVFFKKVCSRHGCPLDPEDGHCPHCALEQQVDYLEEARRGC